MVDAICQELVLRKAELADEITTLYFGGGTPSLLSAQQLQQIFNTLSQNYKLTNDLEFTLEANPDDISDSLLTAYKAIGVNRLSLGIQSFKEKDLRFMNRAHNEQQARKALNLISEQFDNYSIDLIYGVPEMPCVLMRPILRR